MKILSSFVCLLLISSCNLVKSRQLDPAYVLWADKNTDGQWTKITQSAINESQLIQSSPLDIKSFCANYNSIRKNEKIKFWTGLLSSMAFYESGFDTNSQYVEKFKDNQGEFIVSRGLLQLSFESANQMAYKCDIESDLDLHLPEINLSCAIKILSYWINKDKLITSNNEAIKGAGRYWAVLRTSHPQLAQIKSYTQQLDFCNDK
jgi:hypothetical protein